MFEKVERIRPEIEGVEESIAAARSRLMTEIRDAERPVRARPARRTWFLAAGAAGALAAATAGVLIVGGMTAPKPPVVAHPAPTPAQTAPPAPGPTPTPTVPAAPETPQGVFTAASASAIHGGLTPQPGQYLRVTWTSERVLLGDDSTISQPGSGLFYSEATHAWVVRSSGATYIPADLTGDWYWAAAEPAVVTAAYGQDPDADARLQQLLDRMSAAGGDGRFVSGGGSLPEGDGTTYSDYLTSLPADADGVLSQFSAGQGSTTDYHHTAMVGWRLITLLGCNAGSGDVRAAMLQALGRLPGSSIVDSQGSLRTISFDSSFGSEPGESGDVQRHQTITVDVSNGRVRGSSDSTNPGGGIVPDGVADVRSDYVVDVVDGLPG